jgi:hypothetical protein
MMEQEAELVFSTQRHRENSWPANKGNGFDQPAFDIQFSVKLRVLCDSVVKNSIDRIT